MHRHKKYEWIYMTVPVRIVMAQALTVTVLIAPERLNGVGLFIMLADGIGAFIMGSVVGFSGVAQADRRETDDNGSGAIADMLKAG